MELRSAFKIHLVNFWTQTAAEISIILLVITTFGVVTAAAEDFCNIRLSKGNNSISVLKRPEEPNHCNSTEPINWITSELDKLLSLGANKTALPFGIETKLVTCDARKTEGSLSNTTTEGNSTIRIPYYFTSRFILSATKYTKPDKVSVLMFCGNFTQSPNSTLFPTFDIDTDRNNGKPQISNPNNQNPIPPGKGLSNERECEESDLIMYQNESNRNCSCPSPELFHCDDLMECRFLAHWMSKSKEACVVRKVENLCNVTSLSLPDSSRRKGGLLFCDSKKEDLAPYILFYPIPQQQSNSTNMTNNKTGNNPTKIQILSNETGAYEQFLILSILSPGSEENMTTSSKVEIECKGPAFLFLQGFLWNITAHSEKSESQSLPNFNISDPETKHSPDGEKYVSSTFTIKPNHRNQSSVLYVTCKAALSDGNVFISSNLTVKLEVNKPEVTGDFICDTRKLLWYKCKTEMSVNWTWFHENGTVFKPIQGDLPTARLLPKCSNEIITCTAILGNGVNNSYQFQPEQCRSFIQVNCTELLPEVSTTTQKTTTASHPAPTPTSTPSSTSTTTSTSTSTTTPTPHSHDKVIGGISGGFGACLLVFIICVLVLMRKNRKQRERLKMSEEDINDFLKGTDSIHFLPYDTQLEIPKNKITIGTKVLGSGAFGKVVEGQYGEKRVAIKTVNKSADVQYFKALLSEIKIIAFLGKHENLLELIGACTWDIQQRNVYAVFELCENGNLIQFIRKNRNNFEYEPQKQSRHLSVNASRKTISQRISMMTQPTNIFTGRKMTGHDLVRWSKEIACGMDVVAQKKIYHGDLAARNILLDSNLVAKVGDFGLSRQLFEYSVYVQKMGCPLPLKWMSIESLRDLEFSIQSDVWSYGITLWEIFSLGCQPYPNLEWNFASWKSLLDGERMENPEYGSNYIYEIMLKCWNEKPNERPTFAQLKTMFEEELRKMPVVLTPSVPSSFAATKL